MKQANPLDWQSHGAEAFAPAPQVCSD